MIPCDAIMNSLIDKIGEIDLQIVEHALKDKLKEEITEDKQKSDL